MKFLSGLVLGVVLMAGTSSLMAQRDRDRDRGMEMHPRISRAIEALRDARAYLLEARHDFGGHRADAIRSTDMAIRDLELARAYSERR
jgi:hypothetical protein